MKSKSSAIGDPSLIGLKCESGDFSDCDLKSINDHAHLGCETTLMFSDDESTCGSKCGSKTSGTIVKKGWTQFYIRNPSINAFEG